MVVSVWRVVIPEAKRAVFVRDCEAELLQQYRSVVPGLLNVALWHRSCIGYAEVQIIFTWQSTAAMRAFPSDNFLEAIKIRHGYIIIPEQPLSSYDVIFCANAG